MSLILWNFLWSAALMILHTVSSCSFKKMITITDSSSVGTTSLPSNCSCFYTHDQCQSAQQGYRPIDNHCLMHVSEQNHTGECFINKSLIFQAHFLNGSTYKVILKVDEKDIILRFVQNISTYLPSFYSRNTDDCSTNTLHNATLGDLCKYQTECTGYENMYFLHVQNNKIIYCSKCFHRTEPTPTSVPSSTTGKSIPMKMTPEEARQLVKNLTEKARSLCDNCSEQVDSGTAKGLLLKNYKNASVSVGFGEGGTLVPVEESQWSVTVPEEAFSMARMKSNDTPFVVVLLFQDTGQEINSKFYCKSRIFSVSMGANITNLTNSMDMYFRHLGEISPNWSCMSSDDREQWTSDGCNTTIINDTMKCACTHLTFFAILMAAPNQNIPDTFSEHGVSLTYITSIGCGLSTFFLIVGLFVHFVMWRSKTRLGTTILLHLFVALVLLNITFLSNQQITNLNNNVSCIIIAATMHFSMLATFTWFFIQALHFYLSLSAANMTMRKYKLSVIGVGWGFPAVVVIVIAATGNYESIKNVQMCWLTNVYVHYIVNVGYYALIFIFTSIIFIVIVRQITHARFTRHGIIKTSSKKTGAILGLFVLLGLTWGVAFFGYGAMAIPSYYIFTILNSFQGFFLFLYYYFFRNDDVDIDQSTVTLKFSLKKANDTSTTTSTTEKRET